jgi:hypothetical protein
MFITLIKQKACQKQNRKEKKDITDYHQRTYQYQATEDVIHKRANSRILQRYSIRIECNLQRLTIKIVSSAYGWMHRQLTLPEDCVISFKKS